MTSIRKNTAILLMAYGTPSNQNDIEPYLTDIKRGRKPTTAEIEDLKRRYREIGGHSPLQEITAAQASKLESTLNLEGIAVPVHFGMKHWHPYISETAQNFLKSGIRRLISLVLAPHYSNMSIGGYKNILQSSLANSQIEIDFIDSWYNSPIYHQAVSEKILKALKKFPSDKQVLFTAHSLPERIITEGDPYSSQLLSSCEAVAKLSKIEKWSFAYQSAGHTHEKWLGPDILEALGSIGNSGNVLVVPIGFVSDHLEILYDIDVEAQTFARARGINLQRTESLNASPAFIAALADIVRNRIPSN
ncbi:MAG TPA: ferrochelatase [Candidatus Bathyarchaeia archaeon]|nr:ferrochelatase [Candidatus Bathyarchaeia archaeon]